ncbi:MAG: carbon storage regulator [Patescibacteria group bacterium]|nr:carbon storage regulator [Patescibacteria group bacterium]
MLVLSRKKNERILVRVPEVGARDVWVKVVEIRGDKVRLGFKAEGDVDIHREEVAIAIADSAGLTVQREAG